jgi:hypothetical protein
MKMHFTLAPLLLLGLNTTIPATTGTTLDGRAITLPHDLAPRATILILGFTRGSANATTAWEKPVRTSLADNTSINFFDIPFLEDAPSFIRPLILRSIRHQVPAVLHSRFLPLTSGEDTWKQVTGFSPSASDAAYVLLVDRSGTIRWQTHEPFTPDRFQQLSSAARQLASEPGTPAR